jgi:hypothetical protein
MLWSFSPGIHVHVSFKVEFHGKTDVSPAGKGGMPLAIPS